MDCLKSVPWSVDFERFYYMYTIIYLHIWTPKNYGIDISPMHQKASQKTVAAVTCPRGNPHPTSERGSERGKRTIVRWLLIELSPVSRRLCLFFTLHLTNLWNECQISLTLTVNKFPPFSTCSPPATLSETHHKWTLTMIVALMFFFPLSSFW